MPRTPECDGLQPSPVGDVRQEPELTRPLDRDGELGLVAPAGAGHARRADLALVADRAAQRCEVLVVDHVDLVLAERAGLPARPTGRALTTAATAVACRGACSSTLLGHQFAPAYSLLRGQNGMSSSDPPAPTGA